MNNLSLSLHLFKDSGAVAQDWESSQPGQKARHQKLRCSFVLHHILRVNTTRRSVSTQLETYYWQSIITRGAARSASDYRAATGKTPLFTSRLAGQGDRGPSTFFPSVPSWNIYFIITADGGEQPPGLVQVITTQPEVHIYTNTFQYLPHAGFIWAPDIKNKGCKCKEIPPKLKTIPKTKRPTVKQRNTQVSGMQPPRHRLMRRRKTQFETWKNETALW